MFLEAGGGEVRGDVGAGSQGGQALLQPHSLGVLRVGHCKQVVDKGMAFFNSSFYDQSYQIWKVTAGYMRPETVDRNSRYSIDIAK